MTAPFGDGPVRRRMRERRMQRMGTAPPALTRLAIDVAGISRIAWVAPPPAGDVRVAPLLLVLHGAGSQGAGTAVLTGLDRRGPAAGFVTVFPDGVNRAWNDSRDAPRLRRREGVDDVAFLQQLVSQLAADRRARGTGVYLAGISNGGLMSERLARLGVLPVAGIGLVAGQGTEASRRTMPAPSRPACVVMFSGTADPIVPYLGGPIGFGRLAQRRRRPSSGRGVAAPTEVVAREWAAANGMTGEPLVESLTTNGDLPVTRVSWLHAGSPSVVLHRVEGGGHTWPGGPQYLPSRMIGPVARSLDASGIMLEQFRQNEARRTTS